MALGALLPLKRYSTQPPNTASSHQPAWQTFFLLLAGIPILLSQSVRHVGPIAGAVTDTSITLLWMGTPQDTYEIRYGTPGNPLQTQQVVADTWGVARITLTGFAPRSSVSYQIFFQDTLWVQDTVRTFPAPGSNAYVRIGFGSCLALHDSAFHQLLTTRFRPDLFVFLGDWTYPDNRFGALADSFFFADSPALIRQVYEYRYWFPRPPDSGRAYRRFLRKVPIAYTWDDHDYLATDATNRWAIDYNYQQETATPIPIPPDVRLRTLWGYQHFFPHYPLPIDTCIYQKIRIGPVDLFLLDTRTCRTSTHLAFFRDTLPGLWQFQEPPFHTLLGSEQRARFFQDLLSSSAPWKIIVSSIVFAPRIHNLILSALNWQALLGDSAYLLALGMADSWGGYPSETQLFLDFLAQANIQNVVMVTGDIHTGVMDTAQYAPIPELVASPLAQFPSSLGALADSLGVPLWSLGQGITFPDDSSSNFGWIEVFGNDSLRMCLFTVRGIEIACWTMRNRLTPAPPPPNHSASQSSCQILYLPYSGSPVLLCPVPTRYELWTIEGNQITTGTCTGWCPLTDVKPSPDALLPSGIFLLHLPTTNQWIKVIAYH